MERHWFCRGAKRFLGAALAAGICLGGMVTAWADAVSTYSISMGQGAMSVLKGGAVVNSFKTSDSDITVMTDRDGSLLICLNGIQGEPVKVALGEQQIVNFYGKIGTLLLDSTLNRPVVIGANAQVERLEVEAPVKISNWGRVNSGTVNAAASLVTASGSYTGNVVLENLGARIHVNEGAVTQGITTRRAAVRPSRDNGWNLILVNRWNPIPEGYSLELSTLENGQRVDARIYPALQRMLADAQAAGVYTKVVAGYRTQEHQQYLLDDKIAAYEKSGFSPEQARTLAERWVAVPGTSEHQIGLAVDINRDPAYSTADAVYSWLAENAHLYGFIQRYPSDKTDLTGTIYEPWHYRYVGTEAAAEIHRKGICLEEYILALES